jgi:uncharacterized protein (TIGR04141 family)
LFYDILSLAYFNIDILKDLIRSITGEPTIVLPNEYGSVITGNEGIYISPKTNIIKIPEILNKLKTEYHKTTYKSRFDWIDNKNKRYSIYNNNYIVFH